MSGTSQGEPQSIPTPPESRAPVGSSRDSVITTAATVTELTTIMNHMRKHELEKLKIRLSDTQGTNRALKKRVKRKLRRKEFNLEPSDTEDEYWIARKSNQSGSRTTWSSPRDESSGSSTTEEETMSYEHIAKIDTSSLKASYLQEIQQAGPKKVRMKTTVTAGAQTEQIMFPVSSKKKNWTKKNTTVTPKVTARPGDSPEGDCGEDWTPLEHLDDIPDGDLEVTRKIRKRRHQCYFTPYS